MALGVGECLLEVSAGLGVSEWSGVMGSFGSRPGFAWSELLGVRSGAGSALGEHDGEWAAVGVGEELGEVAGSADERPFALRGGEASSHEPAKAPVLFVVAEDRFHGV